MIKEVNFISDLEDSSWKALTLKNVKGIPKIGERVSITSLINTASKCGEELVIEGRVVDVVYSYVHFDDSHGYDFEGDSSNQVLHHVDVHVKQPAQE